MEIRGISEEDKFKLKKSIGAGKRGNRTNYKPKEINDILIKAIEAGTSRTAIARYCGLTSTTQIGRTLSIFNNLDERIHDAVVYGAKNNKLADYETITFQTAYEISRFEKEHQKKIVDFVNTNKISWGRTKSVKQLLERTNKSLDEILNEILVRYNKVPQLIIRERIDLRELSSAIYSESQKERNKIFKKIVKSVFSEDIKSVHLGTVAYSLEFSDETFQLSNKELNKKKLEIKAAIQSYE